MGLSRYLLSRNACPKVSPAARVSFIFAYSLVGRRTAEGNWDKVVGSLAANNLEPGNRATPLLGYCSSPTLGTVSIPHLWSTVDKGEVRELFSFQSPNEHNTEPTGHERVALNRRQPLNDDLFETTFLKTSLRMTEYNAVDVKFVQNEKVLEMGTT